MTPLTLFLDAIAFSGPGVEGWDALRRLLNDNASWSTDRDWQATPECLSARAARRISPQVRIALGVAEKLNPHLGDDAGWVFASSAGEGETLQVILEALREPGMMVQPLRFQNSVHNAAAGQWSIAASIRGPMTSIAAQGGTAGAGFLKTALQVTLEKRPVGLVLYDVPMPEPLDAKRPLGLPLAAGFGFSPRPGPESLAVIEVTRCDNGPTKPARNVSRQLQASCNPVAAVLPLLERLAENTSGRVALRLHGGGSLCLDVREV